MIIYAVYEGTKEEPSVLAFDDKGICTYEHSWAAENKKDQLIADYKKLGIKKPFCVIKFTSK